MTAAPAEKRTWTVGEYLAWEHAHAAKHEFFRGDVFAMAGASLAHNLLVANVVAELRSALRQKSCNVCPSDLRVKVAATGLYTYPDAVVYCGQPELEVVDGIETLLNPKVLIEVLSESSEAHDRGKKFEQYRSIPSFCEYVLVAQDKTLVEHFVRRDDGSWVMRDVRAGGVIDLRAIESSIAVDEIYLKVFETSS